MHKALLSALALVLVLSFMLVNPVICSAVQPAPLPPPGGITLSSVAQLSRAGLSDNTIIAQIKMRPQPFTPSPEELLQLKGAGVSDKVIDAVAGAKGPGWQPPEEEYPTETGVYWKDHGKWVDVPPEVVTLKGGGVLKSSFSLLVVKPDVNGLVSGGKSLTSVTAPCDFLIVLPDNTAITEYQLLALHQHSESREFRTVTGGVFHASTGASRDRMDFGAKKVAAHTYLIRFSSNYGAGEYGFMPPGAYTSINSTSQGKLYSFRTYR